MNNWRQFFNTIKRKYYSIKSVYCPAFNEMVEFRQDGFRHLIMKGNKYRTKKEQIRRLKLIGEVTSIILNSKSFSRNTMINRLIDNKSSIACFWSFTRRENDNLIVVIIRQINRGPKHFLSVFNKKAHRPRLRGL